MLPSQIYEPLPYAYLGIGTAGALTSGFSTLVLIFARVLIAAALLILRMRFQYRRQRSTLHRKASGPQSRRSSAAHR